MVDSKLMPAEALELIRVYRESAHRYFALRTNATYLNIAAAAVISGIMAQGLISAPPNGLAKLLYERSFMYIFACVLICFVAGLVLAITNTLTSAIRRYLAMAIGLETQTFGMDYAPYRWTTFGVTDEFLPDFEADISHTLGGSLWIIINASVAVYAMFLIAGLGFNMSNHVLGKYLFIFGSVVYNGILILLASVTILPRHRVRPHLIWAIGYQSLWVAPFVLLFAIVFWGEAHFAAISPW